MASDPFAYDDLAWNRTRDALVVVERRLAAGELIEHSQYGFRLRQGPMVHPADRHLSDTPDNVFAHLAKDQRGKRVLDMGTGTGVLALYAALKGADVVACDIEPAAVALAEFNRQANPGIGERVRNYRSDLFDNLPRLETKPGFDLILANLMFPLADPNLREKSLPLRLPVYRRFLAEMGSYMRKDAVTLLTCSNAAALPEIFGLFNELGVKPYTTVTPRHNPYVKASVNLILFAFDKNGGPARPGPY